MENRKMKKEYICPILTILKDESTVDFDAMHKLYDRLIEDGISEIALLGSCGEFYAQTFEVCQSLVEDAIKYIDHRTKVLVGANRMDDQLTIKFANKALELGADGILLVGPYYMSCDRAGIITFYNKMAKAIKGDIIIYNYPDRTGYDVNADILLTLLKDNSNIVGIKDTVGDVNHTLNTIKVVNAKFPKFRVYTGYDGNVIDVVKAGGQGVVGGLSNLYSHVCVDLLRNYEAGNDEQVAKEQKTIAEASELLNIVNPFMTLFKYILDQRGIPNNVVALTPSSPMSDEQKQKALSIYDKTI